MLSSFSSLLALIVVGATDGQSISQAQKTFDGRQHWADEAVELCESHGTLNQSLLCHTHILNYERLNVEVSSEDPILIVIHDFATGRSVADFLAEVKSMPLTEQTVVDLAEETNEVEIQDLAKKLDKSRIANGSFLDHRGTPAASKMYDRAIKMLPFINFQSSGLWQTLSYLPGGHYAPHFDYISYASEGQWDAITRKFGNRFATFMVLLQSANSGGGTTFPNLQTTVVPKEGDAIFWTNVNANGSVEERSLHGACVVWEGEKVAAVIWLRERDQDLVKSPLPNGRFDINKLIHPDPKFFGMTPAQH